MKNQSASILYFAVALYLLSWSVGGVRGFAEDRPHTARLKHMSEASLANRNLLSNFSCRFQLRIGTARSVEDALAKGPTENVHRGRALWKSYGEMTAYEMSIPKAESDEMVQKAVKLVEASRTSGQGQANLVGVTFPIADLKVVSDGRRKLSYLGLMQIGTLTVDSPRTIDYITPFDMDAHGSGGERIPGRIVKNILEGKSAPGSKIEITIANELLITEPPPSSEGRETYMRIRFDEHKGYLPIEVSIGATGKPPSVKTVVTETAKCTNGAWYPKRSVEISHPELKRASYTVKEILVDELSVDQNLTPSDMQVEIPEGATINDRKTQGGQFTLAKTIQLSPDRLEKLFTISKATAEKYAKEELEQNPVKPSDVFDIPPKSRGE